MGVAVHFTPPILRRPLTPTSKIHWDNPLSWIPDMPLEGRFFEFPRRWHDRAFSCRRQRYWAHCIALAHYPQPFFVLMFLGGGEGDGSRYSHFVTWVRTAKMRTENGLEWVTAGRILHFSLQIFLPAEEGDKECAVVIWWGVPCLDKCLGSMHRSSHSLHTEWKCPPGKLILSLVHSFCTLGRDISV